MNTPTAKSWTIFGYVAVSLANFKHVEGPDGTYRINFNGIPPELIWDGDGTLHVKASHEFWVITTPEDTILRGTRYNLP